MNAVAQGTWTGWSNPDPAEMTRKQKRAFRREDCSPDCGSCAVLGQNVEQVQEVEFQSAAEYRASVRELASGITWMNLFHARTWTAPAIVAGILAILTGPLAPVTFFVVFPLLVVLMLFAAPMECDQCGKRLPTNVTLCKKCGADNG